MRSTIVSLALLCAIAAQAAAPAKKAEPRVDSMVYDKGMEWKVFPAKGPVVAFAVEGTNCYVATAEDVICYNYKSGQATGVPKLGNLDPVGVTAMAADGQGNVWFGTKNGVALKARGSFTNITESNGLANNAVTALAGGNDGSVWVGTEKGLSVYRTGAWKSYGTKDGLVGEHVTALAAGPGATMWIGTTKGINSFDGATWARYTMAQDNCLSWNDTKALAYDPKTRTLWAAVGEQDVNSFNGTAWSQYMGIAAGIQSIMTDTQSRVWFGMQGGLIKFNGEEWISDAKKLGVPAVMVTQMYRDAGGNLWFASDKGVFFLNNPYPF